MQSAARRIALTDTLYFMESIAITESGLGYEMKMPIYAYKMAQDDLLYRKLQLASVHRNCTVAGDQWRPRWSRFSTQLCSFWSRLSPVMLTATNPVNPVSTPKWLVMYRVGQKTDCFLKVWYYRMCWHRIAFYIGLSNCSLFYPEEVWCIVCHCI